MHMLGGLSITHAPLLVHDSLCVCVCVALVLLALLYVYLYVCIHMCVYVVFASVWRLGRSH